MRFLNLSYIIKGVKVIEVFSVIILRISRHRYVDHICRQGDMLLGSQVNIGHGDIYEIRD